MNVLEGGPAGGFETRRAFDGSTIVGGRFPYSAVADFGRGRTETFEPGAFADSVRSNEGEVHLLYDHNFGTPLARRGGDSLSLSDDGAALVIEARISADLMKIGFVADAVGAIEAGLVVGLSPGFVVDSPKDQFVTRTDGGGVRRHIRKARLIEISAVTRAAYPDAQVQARDWQGADAPELTIARIPAHARWR